MLGAKRRDLRCWETRFLPEDSVRCIDWDGGTLPSLSINQFNIFLYIDEDLVGYRQEITLSSFHHLFIVLIILIFYEETQWSSFTFRDYIFKKIA